MKDSYGDEIPVARYTLIVVGVVVLLVGAIVGLYALFGLQRVQIDDAQIGAYYTGGPIEGKHFDHVMKPGASTWVINDTVYKLPARQITWIAGEGTESDTDPLQFQAKGGERMVVSLSSRLRINTDQESFRGFFTSICQKFDCWQGSTGGHTRDQTGWNRMLRETIGNPQQAVVRDVGLQFDAQSLRYNEETRKEFAAKFSAAFAQAQRNLIGGADYFCGTVGNGNCPDISVVITDIHFVDPGLETIKEQQELAVKQQQLAVEQTKAAAAQQRVNAAKATPEYSRVAQADAMRLCAAKPDCRLTFIVGANGANVAVPSQ